MTKLKVRTLDAQYRRSLGGLDRPSPTAFPNPMRAAAEGSQIRVRPNYSWTSLFDPREDGKDREPSPLGSGYLA